MKITIYELLGLMLKRQAPKKIEVLGFTMNYVKNAHWGDYEDETTGARLSDFRLNECLNDEVEILEEEKKIPEKLEEFDIQGLEVSGYSMTQAEYLLEDGVKENRKMINWILDYLKSKGDE